MTAQLDFNSRNSIQNRGFKFAQKAAEKSTECVFLFETTDGPALPLCGSPCAWDPGTSHRRAAGSYLAHRKVPWRRGKLTRRSRWSAGCASATSARPRRSSGMRSSRRSAGSIPCPACPPTRTSSSPPRSPRTHPSPPLGGRGASGRSRTRRFWSGWKKWRSWTAPNGASSIASATRGGCRTCSDAATARG